MTTSIARSIVANLLRRKRSAHKHLRLAKQEKWTDEFIARSEAAYNEAHNAAEASRRILYDREASTQQIRRATRAATRDIKGVA